MPRADVARPMKNDLRLVTLCVIMPAYGSKGGHQENRLYNSASEKEEVLSLAVSNK
jgi:hypothetical protein